ncbi:helix-turn-helix domain-containing protein [Frigoribacterium faeni]|uniref:helix-turn-helix domain-containing protein n=1 Tax=Frigoribacterium faeni TaxID=145483 RepID=UPI002413025A|nr:helix-turn-helix transcriptional regulator [Frigoribacterium faeni]
MQTATQPDYIARPAPKRVANLQRVAMLTTGVGLALAPMMGLTSTSYALIGHRAVEPVFQSTFRSDGAAAPVAFPAWGNPGSPAGPAESPAAAGDGVPSDTVAALRESTGLTADQLGRLFGVSRRSIQSWVAGGPMAAPHQERLSVLLARVAQLGPDTPARKKALLSSSNGPSLFHRFVSEIQKDAILQFSSLTVRDRLGV